MRVFLAGAAGAVGRRLVPLLIADGHCVTGSTRLPARARDLAALGVEPAIMNVFDDAAVVEAVRRARPEVVIHQLTDLPPNLDPAKMPSAIGRNARIRDEGTRNLVAAAALAGARRLVAQSIAWAYAVGPQPHAEEDDLDLGAEGDRAISIKGVASLEGHVTSAPALDGVILRYGQLYGPGTGFDAPSGLAPVHVDAAAHAARLALDRGPGGIYNIAEERGLVSAQKARTLLGWDAGFRSQER